MNMHLTVTPDDRIEVRAIYTCHGAVYVPIDATQEMIDEAFKRACDLATAQAFKDANERTSATIKKEVNPIVVIPKNKKNSVVKPIDLLSKTPSPESLPSSEAKSSE